GPDRPRARSRLQPRPALRDRGPTAWPRDRGRGAAPRVGADAGGPSRDRPLGLPPLPPGGDRRGPAGHPRGRPDPLPPRVVRAARLLRDPLRGRADRDPRDTLRRDGGALGRAPGPDVLRDEAGGRGPPPGRPGRRPLGERVDQPAARRAHRLGRPRRVAGSVRGPADPLRRDRRPEAPGRRLPVNAGFEYREQVGGEAAGESVLGYLARRYRHSTEAAWRERIAAGEVLVEEATAVATDVLRVGQSLVWRRPPWEEPPVPLAFAVLHRDDQL